MQKEFRLIDKRIKWLKVYAIISSILFAILFTAVFIYPKCRFDIIHAKGIVIEDSIGKDRILIGSPIPFSKDRVRTDTALVRKYWGKKFGGDEYMKAYLSYRNTSNGIIFLNENGFDKVAIGDKLVDPNTGKRLFESTGVLFNDDEGFERAGIGVNKTNENKYRAAMGLDDDTGEALHVFTLEDGTKAIRIADNGGYLLLGISSPNGTLFQNKEAFTGIKYFNNKGEAVWEKNILRK